jgi:hypothetical protein
LSEEEFRKRIEELQRKYVKWDPKTGKYHIPELPEERKAEAEEILKWRPINWPVEVVEKKPFDGGVLMRLRRVRDRLLIDEETGNIVDIKPTIKEMTFIQPALSKQCYEAIDSKLPAEERIVMALACIPPSDIVFTNPSPSNISQVSLSDFCLNSKGDWQRITRTFRREYQGKILAIKPSGLPTFHLTPEHPVLVRRRVRVYDPKVKPRGPNSYSFGLSSAKWISASDVRVGDFLVIPKLKKEEEYTINLTSYVVGKANLKKIPMQLLLTESIATLFGWYLAEGYASKDRVIEINLGKHEKRAAQTIKKLFKKNFGLKTTVKNTRTATRIVACSAILSRFLRQNFGHKASEKRIPKFMMNAKRRVVRAFLRAYIEGDGNMSQKNKTRISTVSKTLAYQLILLLTKLDILGRLYERAGGPGKIEGRDVKCSKAYVISIPGKQIENLLRPPYQFKELHGWPYYVRDKSFFYTPVRTIASEHYLGKVMNIATEDETFTNPFTLVHNCSESSLNTKILSELTGIPFDDVSKYAKKLVKEGTLEHVRGVITKTKIEREVSPPSEPIEEPVGPPRIVKTETVEEFKTDVLDLPHYRLSETTRKQVCGKPICDLTSRWWEAPKK